MPAETGEARQNKQREADVTSTEPAVATVTVTVVTSAECHFCEDAQAALAVLAKSYPLEVRLVGAESPAGQALLRRHGGGMFPLVVVNGKVFSAGRLPQRKLERLLATRPGRTAGAGEE